MATLHIAEANNPGTGRFTGGSRPRPPDPAAGPFFPALKNLLAPPTDRSPSSAGPEVWHALAAEWRTRSMSQAGGGKTHFVPACLPVSMKGPGPKLWRLWRAPPVFYEIFAAALSERGFMKIFRVNPSPAPFTGAWKLGILTLRSTGLGPVTSSVAPRFPRPNTVFLPGPPKKGWGGYQGRHSG